MDFFENKKNVKTVHSKSCRLSSIYSGAGNSIKHFFQQSHTVGIICPHLTDAGSEVWVGGRYVMGPGLPCAFRGWARTQTFSPWVTRAMEWVCSWWLDCCFQGKLTPLGEYPILWDNGWSAVPRSPVKCCCPGYPHGVTYTAWLHLSS